MTVNRDSFPQFGWSDIAGVPEAVSWGCHREKRRNFRKEWWPDGGDALETLPVLLGIIISFCET
jgi:hypothetical protein